MDETISVRVNGDEIRVSAASTVAAAVALAGVNGSRRSVTGQARGPLCGMGICFECRVTIDSRMHQRSCQIVCRAGMEIRTDELA